MKRSTVAVRADCGKLRAPSLLALLALLLFPASAAAQVPPNEDWRSFETGHFRVTFPNGLEPLARRAGWLADRAWGKLSAAGIETPSGPIDLVLTDHVDHSNGFAGVAPRKRIVVYARPPVDGYGLTYYDKWMELVITHELTHVFQFETAGPLGRILRGVFGRVPVQWPFFPNQGTPGWVTEGLAVYYETALTESGRAEGTYHDMQLRTAALEGALEDIDEASGHSPIWPAGDRPYVYGSRFFQWLMTRHEPEALGGLIDAIADQTVPYRLNAAAEKALGTSLSDEWRLWKAELETQAVATRASLQARAPITTPETIAADAYYVLTPRVSPDGTTLAFARADGLTDPQVRVTAPDGSASRQLARTNDASFFTWMPDGSIVVAQLDYADPYHLYSDLYRIDPDGGSTRITEDARLDHPAAEPDGRSVLAIRSAEGTTELVRVDLALGTVTPVVPRDPDVVWSSPAASPDGRWIAAARHRAARSFDIVILDAATGRVVQQVTDDRAVDLAPTWTVDGGYLLWSSDRSGIPNVMAVAVDANGQTGPVRQVTNMVTGVAFPSVDPAMRWIYMAGYHANGWAVERVPFEPARWLDPFPLAPLYVDAMREPGSGSAVATARDYHAASTLVPTYWEPTFHGPLIVNFSDGRSVTVFGPTFGFLTEAQDVVGRHWIGLDANVSTTGAQLQGELEYQFSGLGNPGLGIRLGQRWDASGPLLGQKNAPRLDTLYSRERERFASAGATVWRRGFRVAQTFSANAGLIQRDAERLDRDLNPSVDYPLERPSTHLGELRGSASISTARAHSFSISKEEGASLSLNLRARRELQLPDSLKGVAGVDRAFREATLRLRAFQPLHPFGLDGHVIALRGSAGIARGPGADRFHFDVGGAEGMRESISGFDLIGGSSMLFPVRGYSSGARGGRFAWSAAAEYRFPIARVNKGIGLVPLHLETIHADVFADAGNAWGPELNARGSAIASVGAEISLDLTLFFSHPMPVRFGIAAPRQGAPSFYFRLGPSF